MSHKEAKKQGIDFLNQMDMFRKRNRYPEVLLQVERRKLSIIMAFMGSSEVRINN